MNLKIMIPLVSLLGLSGCCGGCRYSVAVVGLNQTISNGRNSYKITQVTWSDAFILFTTELSFHDIEIYPEWKCYIIYENLSGNASLPSPFNLDETNLQNEVNIGEDRVINIEGIHTFVFDQVLEDPTDFIADENAYIYFSLFINQTGTNSSWAEIQNDDVTFVTE